MAQISDGGGSVYSRMPKTTTVKRPGAGKKKSTGNSAYDDYIKKLKGRQSSFAADKAKRQADLEKQIRQNAADAKNKANQVQGSGMYAGYKQPGAVQNPYAGGPAGYASQTNPRLAQSQWARLTQQPAWGQPRTSTMPSMYTSWAYPTGNPFIAPALPGTQRPGYQEPRDIWEKSHTDWINQLTAKLPPNTTSAPVWPPFAPGTQQDSRPVNLPQPDVLPPAVDQPQPDYYPTDYGDYPEWPSGGGYGGGGGYYEYPEWPSGGGYGGGYNDINKWYANMVQWNINKPKTQG